MAERLSARLMAIVDALPLRQGMRVRCGSGDRKPHRARARSWHRPLRQAIAQARTASHAEIASGNLSLRRVAVEELELEPGEAAYDIAFAVRVGALDERYLEAGRRALQRIAAALTASGRLFIDRGDPLREISLHD